MNSDYFRQLAERCRQLIPQARVETVKQQLKIWADEFDARAEEAERERSDAAN